MNRPSFKHLKKGDKVSAREYNRLIDLAAGMANSLHIQGFTDSTGFHTRRMPVRANLTKPAKIQVGGIPADDPPDATTHFHCKLVTAAGVEFGDVIDVYPRLHLGVNPYDGNVWPVLAAADIIPVCKDWDNRWYIEDCVFDDTVTCEGGQALISASSDAVDVSNGISSVLADTGGGNIVLGGLSGGIIGQFVTIIKITAANSLTLEHNEPTGAEKFIMHVAIDETLGVNDYGGYTFVYDGTSWFDTAHARHV